MSIRSMSMTMAREWVVRVGMVMRLRLSFVLFLFLFVFRLEGGWKAAVSHVLFGPREYDVPPKSHSM